MELHGGQGHRRLQFPADPKIQLEQAINEAHTQHRQLKEQAANVIANQKQTEIRLNRTMEEYEKVSANARQAVMMADDAQKKGDAEKVTQYTTAAEAFANRMIGIEREVEDLKALHLQASQAAEQAKQAVNQNSANLQKKLSEKQKLMSQIDQAQMQEQLNKAMTSLSEKVGEDVPLVRGDPGEGGVSLRPGQGCSRAQRGVGRRSDARGRAGLAQRRSADPAQRDPLPARARSTRRQRTGGRRRPERTGNDQPDRGRKAPPLPDAPPPFPRNLSSLQR